MDEGLLEIPILATQLIDEFKKRKYRDQISRLYLRIACRTAIFPKILEEGLEDLWAKENLSVYEFLIAKAIITYIDKLSETPDQGA